MIWLLWLLPAAAYVVIVVLLPLDVDLGDDDRP